MAEILEGLNAEQLEAVTHKDGPLIVVAGAGCGKTAVITHRIAWLIDQRLAKPEEILALTFTEKASSEMEERVDRLLPMGYAEMWVNTFHGFCERILREYGVEIGISSDFKVLSEIDAWLLMRTNFDKFDFDYFRPLGNPTKYMKSILTHFSRAKDQVISPDDYVSYVEELEQNNDSKNSDEETLMEVKRAGELARAYVTYEKIMLENDALDFGALINYTLHLLKTRPNITKILRERFKYILIDEFQDTNLAQYELVKILAGERANLTVVGDDDQSIYKFRGASLDNILKFESDYPLAKLVVLTKNYRSCQNILDIAYKLIQFNNPNRLEAKSSKNISKKLSAERGEDGSVEHLHFATLDDEVKGVMKKILELKDANKNLNWSDFGILVRANNHAEPFIKELDEAGVPYQFMALKGLYNKPIILDLLALMRIAVTPFDSPSFYRVLANPMYKIDSADLAVFIKIANKKGKSLYEAANMSSFFNEISDNTRAALQKINSLQKKLADLAKNKCATEVMKETVYASGMIDYIKNSDDERLKTENFRFLNDFFERVKRFEERSIEKNTKAFLDEFSNERDAGEHGSLNFDVEIGPDVVKIMTVHSSKGLEFKYVFIVNLNNRKFPTMEKSDAMELPAGLVKDLPPETDLHLNEERRLMYVAMTRARDALFLTSSSDHGKVQKKKLSKFLLELGYNEPESKEDESGLFANGAGAVDAGAPAPAPASQSESEAREVYELPKYLSFTQIASFASCPLQYKFAHILKIPVFGNYQMSFGKSMHATMHKFFKLWIERIGTSQQNLFAAKSKAPQDVPPVSCDELLELYKDSWIDEWYENDPEREKYRKEGSESLKNLYKQLLINQPKPHSLETGFTLKLDNCLIKGRIDRIDSVEGGVEIIDYKTGSPKTDDKIDKEAKKQLYIYHMACEQSLGLVPVKLTYYYFRSNQSVSFTATSEDLEDLKQELSDNVNAIRLSDFKQKPGRNCRYCDFANICEFKSTQ